MYHGVARTLSNASPSGTICPFILPKMS